MTLADSIAIINHDWSWHWNFTEQGQVFAYSGQARDHREAREQIAAIRQKHFKSHPQVGRVDY
jgi:hypothetical protein